MMEKQCGISEVEQDDPRMQQRQSAVYIGDIDDLQQAMHALDAKHSAAVADATSIFEMKIAEVRAATKLEINDLSSVECNLQAKCTALDRDFGSCRSEVMLLRELVEAVEPKFTSSIQVLRDAFENGLSTQSSAHCQLRERLETVCMDLGRRADVALQQQEQSQRIVSQMFEELDTRVSQLVQRALQQDDVQVKPSLFGNCNRRLDQLEAELRNHVVNKISSCESDIDDLRRILAEEKQHCQSMERVVENAVRAHAEDVKAIHNEVENQGKTNSEFSSKIRDVQQAIICIERDRSMLNSERAALFERFETMEHVFSESAQQSAKAMEHAHTKLEEIKRRLGVCEGNSTGFASQKHIATIHRRINDVEKSLGEVNSECKTEFKAYHEAIADRLDTMDTSLRDTADRSFLSGDTAESLRGQIEHESSRRCDDTAMLRGLLAAEVQRLEALVGDISQKCLDESYGKTTDDTFQGNEAELTQIIEVLVAESLKKHDTELTSVNTLVAESLKKHDTDLASVNNLVTESLTVLTSVNTLVDELQDRFETEQALREAEAVEVRTCLGAEKSSRSADIMSMNQRVDHLENLIVDEISKSLSAGILSSKEARRLRNDIDGHMNQLSSQIDGMNSDAKERITVKIPNPDAGGGPPGGGANNLDPRLASPLASPPAGMRVLAIQPTRPCRWPSPCITSPVSSVPAQPSIKGGADRRAKAVDPTMSPPVPLDPSACVAPPCQQQQPSRLRSTQPLVRQGSLSPSSRMTH